MRLRLLDLTKDIKFRIPDTECVLVNERFFREIDDPHKAYWLGSLFASAALRDDSVTYWRKIGESDHVFKFVSDLNSNANIEFKATQNQNGLAKVTIQSNLLMKDLLDHGAAAGENLRAPILAPSLERHFWRGAMDSRGTLFINSANGHMRLDFTGRGGFCEDFRRYCRKNVKTNANVRHNSRTYRFGIVGTQAAEMAHHLYDDSDLYLERSMRRYKDIWDKYAKS
jgi:hypothetical protein